MDSMKEVLVVLIPIMLTALGTWLTKSITAYYNSKKEDIDDKLHQDLLLLAKESLITAVEKGVEATNQTFIKNKKELTEDDKETAMKTTIVNALAALTKEEFSQLNDEYGDIEKTISILAEQHIFQLNNSIISVEE